MVSDRMQRLGEYLSVAIGIGWFLLFYSTASVLGGRLCRFDGIWGDVYELLGVYPPGVGFGVNLQLLIVTWNDGCNIHTATLPGLIFAVGLLSVGGYRLFRRHRATHSA